MTRVGALAMTRVGECLVDLDIWGENQRRQVATRGDATVRLPSREVNAGWP